MTEIIDVKASEILDSRGNPIVEAEVFTICGSDARAAIISAPAQKPDINVSVGVNANFIFTTVHFM